MKNLICFLFLVISGQIFAANSSPLNFPLDCDEKNLELRFTWIQKEGEDFLERSWFVSYSNIENTFSSELNIKGKFQHQKCGPSFEVLLSEDAQTLLNGIAALNEMKENILNEYIKLKENNGSLKASVVSVGNGVFQIKLRDLTQIEFIRE